MGGHYYISNIWRKERVESTGVENLHLASPPNVSIMMFSPCICTTSSNDLYFLKVIIQDIITNLTSWPNRCTITPVAKVNLEIDSWTTTCKATTAGSSLGFEDNVCEDTLSSQSTYKINIGCPSYKASIAPNQKLLNEFEP